MLRYYEKGKGDISAHYDQTIWKATNISHESMDMGDMEHISLMSIYQRCAQMRAHKKFTIQLNIYSAISKKKLNNKKQKLTLLPGWAIAFRKFEFCRSSRKKRQWGYLETTLKSIPKAQSVLLLQFRERTDSHYKLNILWPLPILKVLQVTNKSFILEVTILSQICIKLDDQLLELRA